MGEKKQYEDSVNLKDFFDRINSSGISYTMIKNVGKELPDNLEIGKDIDILVNQKEGKQFHKFMKGISRRVHHPYCLQTGWVNLYGLPEFEMWRLFQGKDLRVDVTYMLCCKSIMPGKWLPLDQIIQTYAWEHRRFDDKNQWWILDSNTQLVYCIVRCVFDKGGFSDKYIAEIERLKTEVDWKVVHYLLKTIFFKYTDFLTANIRLGKYNDIIREHIKFSQY